MSKYYVKSGVIHVIAKYLFLFYPLGRKSVRAASQAPSRVHRIRQVLIKFDTDAAEVINYPNYSVLPGESKDVFPFY